MSSRSRDGVGGRFALDTDPPRTFDPYFLRLRQHLLHLQTRHTAQSSQLVAQPLSRTMFPSPLLLSRDPSQLARPPKAPTRKGPSIFALLGVSALSFAYFTYVVAKRAEEGDHGRKRTVSPLSTSPSLPFPFCSLSLCPPTPSRRSLPKT